MVRWRKKLAKAQAPLARPQEAHAPPPHTTEEHPHLAHHFQTLEQQYDANILGMWVFLITELMLFGGLFTAYTVFRYLYPTAFAEGSHHLNIIVGTANTAILILSSLAVALAVRGAQIGERRSLVLFLVLASVLGLLFLGLKGFEYYEHFVHNLVPGIAWEFGGPLARPVELFMFLYFFMTGVHALHMIIGIAILAIIAVFGWRGRYTDGNFTPVELAGLYWHFVDIVWIFLFPLLYLYGRH